MPAARNPLTQTLAVFVNLWFASVGKWPLRPALTRGIGWLAAQADSFDPMLPYASDHGEALGENRMLPRGLPYALAPRELTHVSMLIRLPPQTEAAIGITRACLQERRGQPLSHDHRCHTVPGLMSAGSGVLKTALDLSSECRSG